ncbi:WYL domain-containing protein [Anaerocolumna jejuensis DSM 15929]|uniref:WYL domain-containing protein n=1 Tax=Anaerocolumna jejuensis DSM 15929 TaxID=1121322 RepID=A0A1M6V8C5_9FIRM|nr:WYL domain-containing protein [Anaerocolumna jejuensis]SHK77556.1 WYL domain-containing protein [Anaerocolumna jejuensis DSM 15929]
MNLFDETENKYYEFLSRLLQDRRTYKKSDINKLIGKYVPGERDFDVTDTLFAESEGEELFFYLKDNEYVPILGNDFPIRNGRIEQEAAKSLLEDEYIEQFLSKESIDKLRMATTDIKEGWSFKDICKKNIFANGVTDNSRKYSQIISMLGTAVREQRAIIYDNIRPNIFEYKNVTVFPIKIEFSVKNDQFRICAYEPSQYRFIKMNLETMQNIRLTDDVFTEDLHAEYKEYLKANKKTVKLDVEPVSHVIERCFRIFSYYDRKARYDKEEKKYRLEVSYLKADENEVVKDILSLGGYVTVMEPRHLQKEVYRRVLAASKLYEK